MQRTYKKLPPCSAFQNIFDYVRRIWYVRTRNKRFCWWALQGSFWYGLGQWKEALHIFAASHWLSAYPDLSLHCTISIGDNAWHKSEIVFHEGQLAGRTRAGSEAWWRHQMEMFSMLLALCAGNSPVSGKFPSQRPVTRSFNVFFDLCMNKWLSKQSWCWWFDTPSCPLWRHRNEDC